MTKKRAVLYARVSDDDRRYMTSGIQNQLDDCRKYAIDRGYEVVREFFEDPNKPTSGADWLPGIESVMELAERGGFDVLIVRELDRLARDRVKHVLIKHHLEGVGVSVEYVIGQFDQTDEGQFQEGVMREFAHYQRKQLTRKLHRGIRDHVVKGNIKTGGCGVPYGYDLVKENGRSFMVINDYEADIVKLMFELYTSGEMGLCALVNYLDERNIPIPQKGAAHKANAQKGKWGISTVAGILSNETYVGRWYYRKKKRVKNPKTGKTKLVYRPKSEWILVNVPVIISEETFQAAQKQKEKSKRQKGKQHKYLYTIGGMLTCGLCGIAMSGFTQKKKGGKPYAYYICNARKNKKAYTPCYNGYVKVGEAETAVWQWVKEILLDPDRLELELENYQAGRRDGLQPFLNLIESSEAKLADLEKRKGRLIDAYTAGVLSLDEIAAQKVELEKQIKETAQAINQLNAEIDPKMLSQVDMETITSYAEGIREGADLADDDRELQREIFKLLDMAITITATEEGQYLDVTCYLGQSRLQPTSETGSYRGRSKNPGRPAARRGFPAQ
jgi:site-specific DNA recombinase